MKITRILIALLTVALIATGCSKGKPDTNTEAGTEDSKADTVTKPEDDKQEDSQISKPDSYDVPTIDFDIGGSISSGSLINIEPYDAPATSVEFEIDGVTLNLTDNLDAAEAAKIDDLTEEELKAIVEKREALLQKLTTAFFNAGINVNINSETGEVALDSSILFGGDSAELSDKGKDFLNKFAMAYTSVVFSDEFDGFISKVLVEGHTAPTAESTYESGLPLSKQRAETVKAYCAGVSDELSGTLEAIGLSNSKPVKDSTGKVDMAASRRVTFRFLINVD